MRGHFIKPNHKTETIHQAIWFDTETDQVELSDFEIGHKLRFGWAAFATWRKGRGWSEPQWHRFTTKASFWDWVEGKCRPKAKVFMFCHNSNFDYPVVDTFIELPHRKWEPKKIICEAPPTIIEMRKGDRSMILLDTLNWWRVSLSKLGESVGIAKLDMPESWGDTDRDDEYCRQDVRIIMAAVMRWCDFLRERDLGGFASTLAAQAMRTYRHRFMNYPILIDDNMRALECSREAYHGGRTEALFIGKKTGRFHLVDVNSMYPYVMRERDYPTKLSWYASRPSVRDLSNMLRQYLVCARVKVRTDTPGLPIVLNGKLCYPVGEFDCALSTPQLQWVIEHGEILSVRDMSLYQHAPIFRSFIDELYTERLQARANGDEVQAYLLKILMNSLYGKWGQRGMVFDEIDRTHDMTPQSWREIDADTGKVRNMRQLMGVVMEQSREPESSNSHPAIAAHVTAYASQYLFDLACVAGRRHVFYMDTDSLLVDDEGLSALSHLINPTRLGMLKLEGTYDEIEIHGAKDYIFGSKCRTKGVKASAVWSGPNTVHQQKWSGLLGMIRSGNVSMPITSEITKRLKRTYDKGTVGADGSVSPIRLGA